MNDAKYISLIHHRIDHLQGERGRRERYVGEIMMKEKKYGYYYLSIYRSSILILFY